MDVLREDSRSAFSPSTANAPEFGTVGTSLLTRLAVLRLLTNRVAMNGDPVNPEKAFDARRRLSNDPRSFHIDAQPAEHESHLTSLVSSREPTPNIWTDAWLAAFGDVS